MGVIQIFEPEATTNEIENPSAEDQTNGLTNWTGVGAVLSRTNDRARFGRASVKVITSGILAAEGARYDHVTTDENVIKTVSGYARGSGRVRMRVVDSASGRTWRTDPVTLTDHHWIRLSKVIRLGGGGTTVSIYFETADDPQSITFYVDGLQLEEKGYPTTYVDGDLELELPAHDGDVFFRWNGTRGLSSSSRSSRFRTAGRARDVTKGIQYRLWPTQISGFGMAPVELSMQRFASFDRSIVSKSRPVPRALMMTFWASKDPKMSRGSPANLKPLHLARQALENLLKPDLSQETQPALIRYLNGGPPMDLPVFYEGGLEFDGDLRDPSLNSFPVRLLAPDPLWFADSQDVIDLLPYQVINTDYLLARIDGEWQGIGAGPDDVVNVVAKHPITGDIYVGGAFTSFDGDGDCSRICRISADGSTVNPIRHGLDEGEVRTIAFDSFGRIWVGGDFGTIEAAKMNHIAVYDPSTDSWNSIGTGPGFDEPVNSIAIDRNNYVYIVGEFVQSDDELKTFNYIAGDDYPADFDTIGTGPGFDDVAYDVKIDQDGITPYICGDFTAENGGVADSLKRVCYYDPDAGAFTQLGEEGSDQLVRHIAFAQNAFLYATGDMTDIGYGAVEKAAVWNRSEWFPLGKEGDGLLGGDGYWVTVSPKGEVLFVGDFTTVTGDDLSVFKTTWNGTRFSHLDLYIGGGTLKTAVYSNDDIWIGGDFTETIAASRIQTAVNNGKAKAGPFLDVLGPIRLWWLENQTTGQVIKLNLIIREGEHVIFDLRQGYQRAVSDLRGNVISGILPDSDEISLLPGNNRIAFFGDDYDSECCFRWQPRQWSFDD